MKKLLFLLTLFCILCYCSFGRSAVPSADARISDLAQWVVDNIECDDFPFHEKERPDNWSTVNGRYMASRLVFSDHKQQRYTPAVTMRFAGRSARPEITVSGQSSPVIDKEIERIVLKSYKEYISFGKETAFPAVFRMDLDISLPGTPVIVPSLPMYIASNPEFRDREVVAPLVFVYYFAERLYYYAYGGGPGPNKELSGKMTVMFNIDTRGSVSDVRYATEGLSSHIDFEEFTRQMAQHNDKGLLSGSTT